MAVISQRELAMFVVDSFSSAPFTGNPAAVCLLPYNSGITEEDKQRIAAEMNHSETAFIQELSSDQTFDKSPHFNLQWFTPTCEVSMCGHATLASAYILFTQSRNCNKEITFSAKCGLLKTHLTPDGVVSMDFPLADLEDIELAEMSDIWMTIFPTESFDTSLAKFSSQTGKLLIRLQDDFPLQSFTFDIQNLLQHQGKVRGVILTQKGGDKYDFCSRYFSPWNGIPEDPVTGSSHTVLAAYWHSELGKSKFLARQCSKRGGDITVELLADKRVALSGDATLVLKGSLFV